jgi:hypothetical protein
MGDTAGVVLRSDPSELDEHPASTKTRRRKDPLIFTWRVGAGDPAELLHRMAGSLAEDHPSDMEGLLSLDEPV